MFEFIILFILLVVILCLIIYGLFIKPTREKSYDYDYDYEYEDENGDSNDSVEDVEIEKEKIIGYHRKKPAEDVSISKSPTGQFLLKIKSTTYPELFPASEGTQIVLNITEEGIMIDYYHPGE